MAENLLARETSPYLLQHKDNPVAWRAWGPAALAEARDQNRPILLSVGYAACHWCHVMAHESFENDETAKLMNQLFIPIKVDREERPDIDAIYQQALSLMGGQGGWPLTMFLTPDGQPFWGGTYFPPAKRWGRPGFPDILHGVAEIYHNQKDQVTHNVTALTGGLAKLSSPQAGGPIAIEVLDRIAARFAQMIDPSEGGVRGAPKFPNCPMLETIWRGYRRTGEPAQRDAVLLTLTRMSQGGIYDHAGGGFARYSTDEVWLAPHFEKMLYDNAQLVQLLTWAWRETRDPLYAERVAETIGWLLREMVVEGGGFAATLDADSEHEEGKFYVWHEAEIDAALGPDAALFKAHYDVRPGGNWEGKTILNRSARPERADDATEATLARCRETLLDLRAGRVRPGLDDKVLADWNGLMIDALVLAAETFERPDWLKAAIAAWDFVTTTLSPGTNRLHHSWRDGRHHPGTLDDYVQMSRAALALHEATGEMRYLDQSIAWIRVLDAHFKDETAGGYFFTADDTDNLIIRTKGVSDNAVPAGNGSLVQVLARLWFLTGETAWRDAAEAQIAAFSGEIERNAFPLGTLLNGVDFLAGAVQIVIAGEPGKPDMQALHREVLAADLPNRILTLLPAGAVLPPSHPVAGKGPVGGRAAAYVCRGETCSLPVLEAAELAAMLASA